MNQNPTPHLPLAVSDKVRQIHFLVVFHPVLGGMSWVIRVRVWLGLGLGVRVRVKVSVRLMLYTRPAVCIGFSSTCTRPAVCVPIGDYRLHMAVNTTGTQQSAPQTLKTTKF